MASPLAKIIDSLPLIDNHTHQVGIGYSAHGLKGAFTEAGGEAQADVVHSLVWKRTMRELGKLLNCAPTEEAIIAKRTEMGEDAYTKLMMDTAKTFQLLIDDGLYGPVHELSFHDQFTTAPSKRIVRLERLAEDLIIEMAKDGLKLAGNELLAAFEAKFLGCFDPLKPDVVGFKSIAAYRTGLAISTEALDEANRAKVAGALEGYMSAAYDHLANFKPHDSNTPPPPFVPLGPRIRIGDKATVDYLVLQGCLLAVKHDLPIQFHTGHGDADMILLNANPLHMQVLLQDPRFVKLKMVLLHFSWPYSREAGWLASSFKGVYVDCGEIQAFNSRHSLVSALRELMHLSPLNKILYSSDAHIWPETYFVGAKYFREALTQVLTETVADGDLTEEEAIEAAHMICYKNSIEAYKLKDVPSV